MDRIAAFEQAFGNFERSAGAAKTSVAAVLSLCAFISDASGGAIERPFADGGAPNPEAVAQWLGTCLQPLDGAATAVAVVDAMLSMLYKQQQRQVAQTADLALLLRWAAAIGFVASKIAAPPAGELPSAADAARVVSALLDRARDVSRTVLTAAVDAAMASCAVHKFVLPFNGTVSTWQQATATMMPAQVVLDCFFVDVVDDFVVRNFAERLLGEIADGGGGAKTDAAAAAASAATKACAEAIARTVGDASRDAANLPQLGVLNSVIANY